MSLKFRRNRKTVRMVVVMQHLPTVNLSSAGGKRWNKLGRSSVRTTFTPLPNFIIQQCCVMVLLSVRSNIWICLMLR